REPRRVVAVAAAEIEHRLSGRVAQLVDDASERGVVVAIEVGTEIVALPLLVDVGARETLLALPGKLLVHVVEVGETAREENLIDCEPSKQNGLDTSRPFASRCAISSACGAFARRSRARRCRLASARTFPAREPGWPGESPRSFPGRRRNCRKLHRR